MARKIYTDLDMQGSLIKRVGTPVAGTDAANKTFVDTRFTDGDGLNLVGTDFNVVPATGIIVGAGVGIDPAVVVRKYKATIGNGSATAIAVTHGLNIDFPASVSVWVIATGKEVYPDVAVTNANTLTLTFDPAPATNTLCVIVAG